ncbi:LysR family transcriptional regulator [Aquabacter spiritensis]|uniref:DNA-binding transcriptional LysR family regulator n=1 Tax=Aquabacter spiritensis TaxID=933073 RepID=A0A4R3M111_9HYPH|nr:LysR family transcriptional regulator [Aquabacter spiritensis]TCT06781.1 DNA-binding transcriptional LysR family regulator [Aquabacter spiritensis]
MRFTLAQLEAFYWVAKQGTVRDAALHLNLSQPSVSLRIRELETALATTLFVRSRSGMSLTDDGTELMERAFLMLGEAERIQNLARSEAPVRGTLRIGMPEVFAVRCLPALLAGLGAAHPYLRIELHISTSADLVEDTKERRIDLGFVIDPVTAQHLQMVPLGYLERRWVGGLGVNLKLPLTAHDIRDTPILTIPPHASPETSVTRWFRSGGAEPTRLIPCNSVYAIAQLIKRGIGIGILPLPLIEAENADGKLRILDAHPPVGSEIMYAAYRLEATGANIAAVIRQTKRAIGETGFLAEL